MRHNESSGTEQTNTSVLLLETIELLFVHMMESSCFAFFEGWVAYTGAMLKRLLAFRNLVQVDPS